MERDETVSFSVGPKRYGIKVGDLQQIIHRCPEITYLPNAQECILGVINFEGEILPVISLNKFFGALPKEPAQQAGIIVIHKQDTRLGLLVEGKIEFIDAPADSLGQRELLDLDSFKKGAAL